MINMSMASNKLIFVDTWAWLALSNRKDMHHEPAKRGYGEIKAVGYRLVTSDYVLDEVITALFRGVASGSAIQFIESLFAAIRDNRIRFKSEGNSKKYMYTEFLMVVLLLAFWQTINHYSILFIALSCLIEYYI